VKYVSSFKLGRCVLRICVLVWFVWYLCVCMVCEVFAWCVYARDVRCVCVCCV